MKNYFKGIIAGLGGVAPGLSGSVLLIIMGLYRETLEAFGTLFKDFKKKLLFLLPIVAGMVTGVLLFSKAIDFFLDFHEMPTRFCFLGLILGTVPLFYREVKKNGFSGKYYVVILLAAAAGFMMFTLNPEAFEQVSDPSIWQSMVLGVAVAATAIVPGIDPAVLLSTLGFYEMYVNALAEINVSVLLPMAVGLGVGAIVISLLMNLCFQYFYTLTFSVIFGVFLSMIPNMLNETCEPEWNRITLISLFLMVLGFGVSFYLGDWKKNNQRFKKWIGKDA